MKPRIPHLLGLVTALVLTTGLAAQVEYELFIIQPFNPGGLGEAYVRDVNNAGTAAAVDINSSGTVAGFSSTPQLFVGNHAIIWTEIDGMVDLGILGVYQDVLTLDDSRANGINDAGVVVGLSTTANAASGWDARHAFVWDEVNGMRDLNDLADVPADYYLIDATAISNSGWICGTGFGPAGAGFYSGFVLKPIGTPAVLFSRGDCNADGAFDISDAVFSLSDLFVSPGGVTCADACDANDDGTVNIADPVYSLVALFANGPPPAAPHSSCGGDPTGDSLDCGSFASCP